MKYLKNKLKKKYYHLRKKFLPSKDIPNRLIIEKAKWYNDSDSPVMLMVDDLANAWHSKNGSNTWDFGGDWGGGLDRKNSAFSFLREKLLNDFPEARVTFFTVMGSINQYTFTEPFSFSEPFNFSEESRLFLKSLYKSERFEIAYHGYDHGTPGKTTEDFIQEWEGFRSVDDACKQNRKGREIYRDILGRFPSGGKYGGWKHNEFADPSIDRSGFLWWCRDWMPRDISGRIPDVYYEPQFFGDSMVVALPSTLHGFYWDKEQVNDLLKKKQIISIEEHIAPLRPDGITQTPNIIDDIYELRSLFGYLRDKKVWYATGTEVAKYFVSYSQSTLYDVKKDSFRIWYPGKVYDPTLTLIVDCSCICASHKPFIDIILPDGSKLLRNNMRIDKNFKFIVNVPVQNGEYIVRESEV